MVQEEVFVFDLATRHDCHYAHDHSSDHREQRDESVKSEVKTGANVVDINPRASFHTEDQVFSLKQAEKTVVEGDSDLFGTFLQHVRAAVVMADHFLNVQLSQQTVIKLLRHLHLGESLLALML